MPIFKRLSTRLLIPLRSRSSNYRYQQWRCAFLDAFKPIWLNPSIRWLFASSKDFLWSINHDSNDPVELFSHLTAFGQHFYNQFEIAFSATPLDKKFSKTLQMEPFASRNLIYIFKEAMTNTVKHVNANMVSLEMTADNNYIKILFSDNGTWKEMDDSGSNNGLINMERRSKNNNFRFKRFTDVWGTHIEVEVPVMINTSSNFINNIPKVDI